MLYNIFTTFSLSPILLNFAQTKNNTVMKVREEAVRRSASWWFCENLVNHKGKVGLLRLDFPRVFILMRDYSVAYFASFEKWRDEIVEINFLDPKDREGADLEDILIDAWNFLALEEEADDDMYDELVAEDGDGW